MAQCEQAMSEIKRIATWFNNQFMGIFDEHAFITISQKVDSDKSFPNLARLVSFCLWDNCVFAAPAPLYEIRLRVVYFYRYDIGTV